MKRSRAGKALKWAKARQVRDNRTKQLTELSSPLFRQVFGIELIREKILKFAVHNSEGDVSRRDVLSIRLVQKVWLLSCNKILLKVGYPLHRFRLNGPTDGVQTFQKLYKRSFRLEESVSPFGLQVHFERDNLLKTTKSFFDLLQHFRKGLVQLELTFQDQVFIETEFLRPDTWQFLEVLQKLSVSLPYGDGVDDDDDDGTNFDLSTVFTVPMVLASCKQLTCFTLLGTSTEEDPLPRGFRSVRLPETIKKMELQRGIRSDHLDQFVRNSTLNLRELTLTIPDRSDSDLIYRIACWVRNTLKVLKIWGKMGNEGEFEPKTLFKLPIMTCLEDVYIHASYCEWEDGISNLERYLPAIRKIDFRSVTASQLKKWTENSRFETVKEARLELPEGLFDFLTPGQAMGLHEAFPKITKLDIYAAVGWEDDRTPLQSIFRNMIHLQTLSIRLRNLNDERFWSYLLVGIPDRLMDVLERSCRDIWGAIQLTHNKLPSIGHLSNLRELTLTHDSSHPSAPAIVLSDIVFELAFLRMPALHRIKLEGQLEASLAMVTRWQTEGRVIKSRLSLPTARRRRKRHVNRIL